MTATEAGQAGERDSGAAVAAPAQPAAEELAIPHLPPPTVWPVTLALGITLLAFGFVTSLIFTAAGVIIMVIAFAGWIADLRQDAREGAHAPAPGAEEGGHERA
jgi:hypothetical protein